MLTDAELAAVLARVGRDRVTQVRVLLASGWPLEAERVLGEALGDALLAKEAIASLVRRMVIN